MTVTDNNDLRLTRQRCFPKRSIHHLEHSSPMVRLAVYTVLFIIYLYDSVVSSMPLGHANLIDTKVLKVGEELREESLPLQMGSCLYELHGLKASTWYEVKISYPASIPASFSIQLKRSKSDIGLDWKRRLLLNTEKRIFKNSDHGEKYVLVTVEPAGVVAIPHVQERQHVIFNIVCDELVLGIPHKALWVGVLVLFCLALAFILPYFLPSYLLKKNKSLHSINPSLSKDS